MSAILSVGKDVLSATLFHKGRKYAVSIETFTPESAAHAMTMNTNNRPLSRSTWSIYQSALQRGDWMLNGETVVFDQDGNLLQGQHRLHAVIKSGVSLTTFVVRGVVGDAFKTFDTGKKRGVGDALSLSNEMNTNVLASAIRSVVRIKDGASARAVFTAQYATAVLNEHPSLRFWASAYAKSDAKRFMPSSFIAVLMLSALRYGDGPIMEFLEQVSNGVGLTKTMPAYVLREKFLSRQRGAQFVGESALAYIIKAVNAYTSGKSIMMLRMASDDVFPALV